MKFVQHKKHSLWMYELHPFRPDICIYIYKHTHREIERRREFSLDLMKSHMDDKYGHCFNSVIDELIASCFPICVLF